MSLLIYNKIYNLQFYNYNIIVICFAGSGKFFPPTWKGVWPLCEQLWTVKHPERVVSFKKASERGWKSGARSRSWKSGSPQRYKNFCTSGSKKSLFVSEIQPFENTKGSKSNLQCKIYGLLNWRFHCHILMQLNSSASYTWSFEFFKESCQKCVH